MTSRIALGVLALGAGIAWLLSAADVVDLSYATWIGIALIAVGVAVALLPGRRGVLVVLGTLVALAGVPALLVDDELLQGGIGDKTERPDSAADLEPFRQGIGKLTVDLTAPELDLDGATVEASIGIGDLVVLVPDDADATFDLHVRIGNGNAFGEEENGFDVELDGITSTSGSQELTLELDVGIGNVRVDRG
jgi:predicted membrane protein